MQNDRINLHNWMEFLYDNIKSKHINNIILPGTHNSGAYTIDFKNSFIWNNDIINKIKPFRNLACTKKAIINWTVCHNNSIYNQLYNGIRVFDFRISYDNTSDIFYITHTFTCITLVEAINDIIRFINEQPKEIIIIYSKPDWENRTTMYDVGRKFIDFICKQLENYLYDNIGYFPTLEDMVKINKRIIFTYTEDSNGYIWSDLFFDVSWTNTSKIDLKLKGLENSLLSYREGYFNVLDFILTPQVNDIIKSILLCQCCISSATLKGFANKINRQLNNFISKNKHHFNNLSSIYFDFPSVDTIYTVISLNIV